MGGTELILIVLADPPTVRLLTAITAPPFRAGIFSVPSLMLNVRIGAANVPADPVTTNLPPALTLIALLPPPATIELATTVPPLRLSVPVTAAVPPLVRARRRLVFATNTAPVLRRELLFTL